MTKLVRLWIYGNQVRDISPLQSIVSHLEHLYLGPNPIENISLVEDPSFHHLKAIGLSGIPMGDYGFLRNYTQLTALTLADAGIQDVSFLKEMTTLTQLALSDNHIADVSSLGGLTNLVMLYLSGNPVGDLSALADLRKLFWMEANDCLLSDLTPLADLTSLAYLFLKHNLIVDVSPLENLTALLALDLEDNLIEDIGPLGGLTKLTSLNLLSNALNRESHLTYLDQIRQNNPGIDLQYDPYDGPLGVMEGFEEGFNPLGWAFGGWPYWRISSAVSHAGHQSAQAGAIGDDEQTTLKITLDCTEGEISFWRKVSCESNWDYLEFFIDGSSKGKWSGEQDWQEVAFPVTAGKRTFTWTYSKDSYGAGGADTAWIDDITFPAP
jgi:hypothetical protein